MAKSIGGAGDGRSPGAETAPRPDEGCALAAAGFAAYEWDIPTDRLSWSSSAADMLGVAREAIATGRAFAALVDSAGPPGRYATVMDTHNRDDGAGVTYEAEYRLKRGGPAGRMSWVEDIGRWYAGADGRPVRAHGVIRVVDERRRREERLIQRGERDDVTGGMNRPRMIEEIAEAIATARRLEKSAAFASVAVDNLAILNDTYGFDVADDLISGVAARIRQEMRRDDAIGRLSGNRIGIVLRNCGAAELKVAAARFSRAVSAGPIPARSSAVAVTVSIGGVLLPRHASSPGEAMARAQEAIEEARSHGGAMMVVVEPSPERDAARRRNIDIATQVIAALNEGRVALALQPVVAARDGRILFHEALARLVLNDGTLIAANEFIATAERLGIVRLLDHRTLDLAIGELTGDPTLVLTVNVSTASALDGRWLARLDAHLRRNRSIAVRLIVEITETMAIGDMDRAIAFVKAVREMGCRVAIDDFGSGHTSFRNLRSLGADIVKIDGAFIERLTENANDRFFVATLVSLARRIGLKTVAERVSSEAGAAILRDLGVDYLQGHLYGAATPGRLAAGPRSAAR